MKKVILGILLLLAVMALPAGAATTDNVPVSQWVGQEFITLNLPNDRRDQGYDIYVGNFSAADLRSDSVGKLPRLPYLNHYAKRVVVTGVESVRWENENYFIVSMTEKDTNLQLTARTYSGQIDGLVPAADLEKTRRDFVGKTIYAKQEYLVDHPNPATVLVPFGQPMAVTDVWVGYETYEPILLVVEYNNKKAVLPIAYSWTNQSSGNWTSADAWQKNFFVEDPRKVTGKNTEIWANIASSRVETGMSREEVRLSWGTPPLTDTAREDGVYYEIWTYGNNKLYFTGNVLTRMVVTPIAAAENN